MYSTFGEGVKREAHEIMHRKKVHREMILSALHPPADDNLVSKKVANSAWTYRLFKASFRIGNSDVAK